MMNFIMRVYRMRNKSIIMLLVTVIVGFVTSCGCSSTIRYYVSVNALARPDIETFRNYVLIPTNEGITAEDLQFKEYEEYLERALAMSGFEKAPDFASANTAIFISYKIGEPKDHVFSYSVPQYGQTGISSSTTYGSVRSYGGGYGTYSGTTNYQPSYGITGYNTHVGTYTTYTRSLFLAGVDINSFVETKKPIELWRISATSVGTSNDLRRVFPYLVTAAQPYIGKNTDKQSVRIEIKEDDDEVVWIRDGIADD